MRPFISGMVLALTVSLSVFAQADEPFKADEQYVALSPSVPTATPDKIEVVEVFWYGCPHCYQFEPKLNPWIAKLPKDVAFRRIPALFGGIWNAHGQLFLTLEAMGVEAKVHQAIFEALHQKNQKLATPEEMARFLATQGIDADAFLSTFNSFAIQGNMEKARKQAVAYHISGVPALIVNGAYRFDVNSAGGMDQALQLADYLIAQERAKKH